MACRPLFVHILDIRWGDNYTCFFIGMVIGHEITHGFDDQVSAMIYFRCEGSMFHYAQTLQPIEEFSPHRTGLYCAHCFSSILESMIQNTYTITHPVKSKFFAGMCNRYHASCIARIVLYTSNPSKTSFSPRQWTSNVQLVNYRGPGFLAVV